MKRFVPTRSLATLVMTIGVAVLLAMIAAMPFSHLRPMTVGYVAMIVAGAGIVLRERVLAPTTS
jgi:hypothetical protein